jgi:hypothetical protein
MMPWNFREPPTEKGKFEFCNRFVIFPVTLRLFSDFKIGIQAIKGDFNKLKSSFEPYGMYFLSQLVLQLPYPIAGALIGYLATKPTLFITNVFLGNVPFELAGGAKTHKASVLCPFMKDVTGGFAIVSHNDIMCASFDADLGRSEDAKEIIRIFE